MRVPQRVECTRWSSRANANEAFVKSFVPIRETLLNLSEDDDFDAKTRCEALGLRKKMCQLETGILASFWYEILGNLNKTSNTIQSLEVQLNTAIACVKSLKTFIGNKRYSFDYYERLGADLTGISEYKNEHTRR